MRYFNALLSVLLLILVLVYAWGALWIVLGFLYSGHVITAALAIAIAVLVAIALGTVIADLIFMLKSELLHKAALKEQLVAREDPEFYLDLIEVDRGGPYVRPDIYSGEPGQLWKFYYEGYLGLIDTGKKNEARVFLREAIKAYFPDKVNNES